MSTKENTHEPLLITPNRYVGSRGKRVCDLLLAGVGVLVFSPVYLAASVLIKLEDRGPVLFRQARLGHKRREIEIIKLRSMRHDVVTSVGRWLRATGLDETAQFLNVLRGEMSMVGPRPLTKELVERLGWTGQRHATRFQMRPGITGLAQLIGGHSARESYRLDLIYHRRASLWLDLWLVSLSFGVNLLGKQRAHRLIAALRRIQRLRAIGKQDRRKRLRESAMELPFRAKIKRRTLPTEMRCAPALGRAKDAAVPESRYALLLNPFYAKDPHSSFGKHVLTPTLALTSIAGSTPAGWRLKYWDENLLRGPPPSDPIPEVVGITVHLTFAKRAFELADWYRQMGAKVVLGGLHVISCPDECRAHADAIALGDGVQIWPRILEDAGAGRLQPVYRSTFCGQYRDDPIPARELLPEKSFLTTASINATRGCINRCRFCYLATRGLKMPYRSRDVEQVVEAIRQSGEPYVVFTDNNLGSDREYLRSLCEALRPLETVWSAAVSIDVTDDPDLVRAMALSGCTGVFVGFESLSDANLAAARKKTPLAEDYARRVEILHDNGIQVNGSFVFGFDDDHLDVFARTVEWIEENRLECATLHILTPYPGTPLFREMEEAGRLRHKDWELYDTSHVVFRPRHMTPDELERGYAWAYQRLFSHTSIWNRRPAGFRAVIPYLAMAYLYKRANWLWRLMIKKDLVKTLWSPMVELTRRRHLRFRKELETQPTPGGRTTVHDVARPRRNLAVISAGL